MELKLSLVGKTFVFFSVFVFSFGSPLLMKKNTDGFHPARLFLQPKQVVLQEEVFFSPPQEEILHILSQPFFYLSRGAQCYVFESEDTTCVLKFFQKNRRPFSSQILQVDLSGGAIAYRLAKEETAILYAHLCPSNGKLPRLNLRAPLGQWFSIALDDCYFVLQRKVSPFKETLVKAAKEGSLSLFVSSFLDLLDQRAGKGIRNGDVSLCSNFGFLGQRAVEIDFGRYAFSESFLDKNWQTEEKKRFVERLQQFLRENLPQEQIWQEE